MLLLAATFAWAELTRQPSGHSRYSNSVLGFRYSPPPGLIDGTKRARADVKLRTGANAILQAQLLLSMASGFDDSTANWRSLTILTLPRTAFPDRDDTQAEAKTNAFIAHSQKTGIYPRSVSVSGQAFAVSVFGLHERGIVKGAVVWTTVRKGKLLSFAFAANSPEVLKALTESMKTVQFY